MLLPVLLRSRLVPIRRAISAIYTQRHAQKHSMQRCDAHMNELPIPCIPWDIYYKDQQSYYTKWLVAGAVWWLFSLSVMIMTGSFYLNWGPPAQPGPPSDMVEECEDE